MQTLLNNKNTILLALILLAAMFGYRSFVASGPAVGEQSALVIGEDLLKLSNDLSQATLPQDVFTMPGYRYLTDFSVPVPQQDFGRTNPFDLIGR